MFEVYREGDTTMPRHLMNAKAAAAELEVSVAWIHKLVRRNLLTAHTHNAQGDLVKHRPGEKSQGRSFFFTEADIRAYKKQKPRKLGRPYGARDKKKRVLKASLELAQEVPENT